MAEMDLVSQKILGTDPQVGFGESAVLPYRQHTLDTRGFEAMERAKTRRNTEEADLQKTNEAFYNERLNKLNEYDHVFSAHMDSKRKKLVDTATETIRSGKRLAGDSAFNQAFTEYQALAQGTMQLQKQSNAIEQLTEADVGKYTDLREVKAESAKMKGRIALAVNDGDVSALQGTVTPTLTDPKFFKSDEFIYDKVKDIKVSTQGKDTRGSSGLGEYITHTEKGYKFATKDANGNLIPGVDKSVVDYFLSVPTQDPDMLQFRAVIDNLSNSQIENKALRILQTDPRFKNLRKDEIPAELKRLKQQIAFDPKSEFFEGKDAIQQKIVRDKLSPFQETKESTEIKQGFKYNTDGDGDGKKNNKFRIEPTIITQESGTGLSHNSPGVVISKNDKPLTLNVAANTIYDWKTGLQDVKNTDRVPIKANSVGYGLADKKTNKIMAFSSVDEMVNYINTAPKKDLDSFSLNQYIFGNIEEKKTVGGDTGEDEPEDQNENRSIAIKYNKDNETGAQINLMSEGVFNNRELTADEKRVKDAYEKRYTKKQIKPLTVVQNGHTYTLNKETGTYE